MSSPPSPQPAFRPTALVRGLFLLAAAPALGILRAAPIPLGPDGRAAGPASQVRRSMRASMVEGVFAELVNACAGPVVLVAWALHLGATPFEVALVGALPQLASLAQLPAAWATALLGRRKVALATLVASRQVVLPLAAIPALGLAPAQARALVLAASGLAAVLAVAGNNAWTTWMGELVPARIRGRYFGVRTAALTLGSMIATLAAGLALDGAAARGLTGQTLSFLTLLACAFGAVTGFLLTRQHEPEAPPAPRPTLADLIRPLRDGVAQRVLAYQIAWNGSVGLAAAYFTWHMVANVRVGFTVVALHAAGSAAARVLSAPLWGRAIDRLGARPVLAACSFGCALLPPIWLLTAPGTLWPIAVDALLSGVFWGGHALAAFAVPLAVAPRVGRPFYLAAFATAGGLAFGVAAALSGLAMAALPPEISSLGRGPFHPVDLAFVASAACRMASAFLALRISERGAGSLRQLRALAAGAARGAFAWQRAA
jgi:MFS family permease